MNILTWEIPLNNNKKPFTQNGISGLALAFPSRITTC